MKETRLVEKLEKQIAFEMVKHLFYKKIIVTVIYIYMILLVFLFMVFFSRRFKKFIEAVLLILF
jgi:hypothetical protein